MIKSQFKVGQVLFVLMWDDRKVVPVQVVEEVVRKTLQGETIDYIAIQNEGGKKINLERLREKHNVEFFESASNLKEAMVENANKGIDAIIDSAIMLSKERFDVTPSLDDDLISDDLDDLPDPVPPVSSKPKRRRSKKKEKPVASPEDSDGSGIVLENGTRVGKITLPPELEDLAPNDV